MLVTAPARRTCRRAYRRPFESLRVHDREPENTALYRIVEDHLPAFFERLDSGGAGADWPGFVRDEFEEFLRCGVFLHGFCRVHCATCGHDALVGFS